MPNYLRNSLKRHVNRRMNRMVQRQVNQGVDSVLNQVFGTPNRRYGYRQGCTTRSFTPSFMQNNMIGSQYSGSSYPTFYPFENEAAAINHTNHPSYGENHHPTTLHSPEDLAQFVQMGNDDFDDNSCNGNSFDDNVFDDMQAHSMCDTFDNQNSVNQANHSTQSTVNGSSFASFNISRPAGTPTDSVNFLSQPSFHSSSNHQGATMQANAYANSQIPLPSNGAHSQQAHACYQIIDNKANSNAVLQGVSGFFGFVATMAVDVGTIPLIYATLWNEIRAVYGQPEIGTDDALKVIANILPEVLSDAVFDKVLGNVPIIGVYFNAICAKQMTWRLGTLFTLLASRGEAISSVKCKEAMMMIRHMFPQKDIFSFTTPDREKFIQMADSVSNTSTDKFNEKVESALSVFMAI